MDIDDRYTYEIQLVIAFLWNRKDKLRYSEPIVYYIWNSRQHWTISWVTADSDKNRIQAWPIQARNGYSGILQEECSAKQSTY